MCACTLSTQPMQRLTPRPRTLQWRLLLCGHSPSSGRWNRKRCRGSFRSKSSGTRSPEHSTKSTGKRASSLLRRKFLLRLSVLEPTQQRASNCKRAESNSAQSSGATVGAEVERKSYEASPCRLARSVCCLSDLETEILLTLACLYKLHPWHG